MCPRTGQEDANGGEQPCHLGRKYAIRIYTHEHRYAALHSYVHIDVHVTVHVVVMPIAVQVPVYVVEHALMRAVVHFTIQGYGQVQLYVQ